MSHALRHDIDTFKRGLELFAKLLSDHHHVRVVHRGTDCYTDGTVIVLPEISLLEKRNMTDNEIADAKKFLINLRGFVNHEVGHVLYTRFADIGEIHDKWKRKGGSQAGALAKMLWNIVEDGRVERLMKKSWSNADFFLDHMWEWMNSTYKARRAKKIDLKNAIMMGISIACREGVESKRLTTLPKAARKCLHNLKDVLQAAHEAKTQDDTYKAAEALVNELWNMQSQPPLQEESEGSNNAKKSKKDDDSSDDKGGNEEGNSSSCKASRSSSDRDSGDFSDDNDSCSELGDEGADSDKQRSNDRDSKEGGDEESHSNACKRDNGNADVNDDNNGVGSVIRSSDVGERDGDATVDRKKTLELEDVLHSLKHMSAKEIEALEEDLSAHAKITRFASRNFNRVTNDYRVYTNEFDVVSEAPIDVTSGRLLSIKTMQDAGVVRRRVANVLKARSQASWLREKEEGKLDTHSLHKLLNGKTKAIFKQRRVQQDYKNISVILAINLSGSMSQCCDDYGMGSIIRLDLAKRAALIMGEVLDSLKISFEIIGHTCKPNEKMLKNKEIDTNIYSRWMSFVVVMVKSFTEPFAKAKQRIPSLHSSIGGTYDSEVVEFCSKRLLNNRSTRKIVIMLDDGCPWPTENEVILNKYDSFYKCPLEETKQRDKDAEIMLDKHRSALKKMVNKYEGMGVEILGVGMGTDSVTKYYKRSIVLNNNALFVKNFADQLQKVLICKVARV